ncbi:interferon-induced protein 44-like [Mustelus asterias]
MGGEYSTENDSHGLTVSKSFMKSLQSKLWNYNPPRACGDSINILLFGLVGAGKSATINTILSALDPEGKTISYVPTGLSPNSLTPELRFYTKRYSKSIKFWDTAGWDAVDDTEHGKKVLTMILEGRVPKETNLHNFNSVLDVREYPVIPENVIHGVAFIVNLDTMDNISTDSKKQFEELQTIVAQKHIYRIVIGTKFDLLGIPNKYHSYIYQYKPLQKKLAKLSEDIGINKDQMFAISNEWKGDTIDQTRCVLILHALENMVKNIDEYYKSEH